MASDLNSVLKKYLSSLGKNEANATEIAKSVRTWVVENGEIAKEKIEKQIEETVSRMGFAKTSDLDLLMKRISELESRAINQGDISSKPKRKKEVKIKSVGEKVKTKASTKKGDK